MIDDIYIHATTPLTLFIGAVYKFAYLLIESRTMWQILEQSLRWHIILFHNFNGMNDDNVIHIQQVAKTLKNVINSWVVFKVLFGWLAYNCTFNTI